MCSLAVLPLELVLHPGFTRLQPTYRRPWRPRLPGPKPVPISEYYLKTRQPIKCPVGSDGESSLVRSVHGPGARSIRIGRRDVRPFECTRQYPSASPGRPSPGSGLDLSVGIVVGFFS